MRTEVITVNPELHVERAWEIMERQRVHHLPVVKNAQLVGSSPKWSEVGKAALPEDPSYVFSTIALGKLNATELGLDALRICKNEKKRAETSQK